MRMLTQPRHQLGITTSVHGTVDSATARVPVIAVTMLGHIQLGVDTPWALVGVPIAVQSRFCDPERREFSVNM